MSVIASQITSLTTAYSAVYSGPNQEKHQSSASLAFVRGIHRWPVNSPHKGSVKRKIFPFNDVIMTYMTRVHYIAEKGAPFSKSIYATAAKILQPMHVLPFKMHYFIFHLIYAQVTGWFPSQSVGNNGLWCLVDIIPQKLLNKYTIVC